MLRDGFDAVIFTDGPDIYSHGSGVAWGAGLLDDRGMCQYLIIPLKGDATLIYPHYGCHIESAQRQVSVCDVRSGQHGKYGKAVAERLIELGLQKARIGITAADRTGPEYMGMQAFNDIVAELKPGGTLENVRKVGSVAFRKRGAQSRPTIMHGLDLITSVPFVRCDLVRAEGYETTMQPGMTYNIEITPVDAEGIFGIFFSRSFAITDGGHMDLTPYPIDEILVAG